MKKIFLLFFVFFLTTIEIIAQNNALSFDGTDDYVNIPSEPLYNSGNNITSFTQEAWIYSSNTDANYHGIMGSQTSAASDRGPSIYVYNTTNIHFGFSDGSSWYSHDATNVIEANTWTHIAITYDGTNYSLYVNGILKLSSTNHAGHYPISGVKYIGKVDGFFSGRIDEVRIWNDARTETEIRQNMYQELSDPSSETNLVTYYKFNATSGTTLTDSKGSHTGALTNMTGNEWTATSNMLVSKKCLNFDGSDDYVTLPSSLYSGNLSGGTAITIEYWFKGAALHSAVRFQDGGGYIVAGWSDPPQFIISSDGSTSGVTIGTDSEIEDGNWHHIACVWEANTTNGFRTYLDGVLKNQRNSANVTLPTISSGAWLGSLNGGELLTGSLDEVRIWNTARTATQIRENMTRTLEGGESGLVAYYSLNEAGGTTVYDATSNSYNGTISGGATWTNSESFTTWLGLTSSDWSTASNWTNGVPTSSSNVGIYKWTDNYEVAISGSPTVNSLVISSSSTPTLSSGITVNGNLFLEKDMDLSGQTITLGSSATLVEDAGVFSGSSGSITTTRDLDNINENVAGMGATITTSANMGSTSITRTHAQTSGKVFRQYAISPSTNTGLNATLEFNYLDSELNSLNEANFQLLKSADGTTWNEQGGIVSRVDNTITLSGIDGFSHWTVNEYIQPMNNYALDFDGDNDYVAIPDADALDLQTNYTLEAWVYPRAYGSYVGIISKYQTAGVIGYTLRMLSDGKIDIDDVTSSKVVINSLNTWYHIAAVNDNGTRHVYINGIEVTTTGTPNTVSSNSDDLRIGSDFGRTINAIIDEARIWNDVRTATEIRENMTRTLDGNESGLVAYYRLNEAGGTMAYDATANGHNGTLTNMDESTDWVDSEAFNTWLGGTSTDWSTSTNWTDGVPTSTDNVGIYKWTNYNEAAISGSPTVNSLVISSTSNPTLSSGITVNGNLFLEKDMVLSGQTITLGSSATLVEDAGVFSGSSGSITTTRDLNNINEDVAGMGATITTSADLGSTTITRTHNSVSGNNFNSSVLRQYAITPTTTTGLNATLEFNYLDSELNGLKEVTLQLIKSTDGGTTWIDQGGGVSTTDNTVTLSGIDGFSTWGVTQLIQPMNNYALDFDGVNDYVECGNNASITEFNNLTVEAWIKLENANNNQKIVGKYKDSGFNDFYVMGVNGGEYHFEIAAGSQANRISFSAGNVPNNTWTHLAVTYSKGNGGANGTFYGYVNGELVYSKTDVADAAINVSDASYPLRIGVGPWDVNVFKVDGQIDEVRIWNTARTATQIRENMCRTLDGDESGLVAYYRLNETSGTTVYDASSNSNNGTISGGATWVNSESFNTWLGGTSNAWSTETNWTDGVPTLSDNVGIYKWTGYNEVAISGSPTINNLVISSTSTPTLSSGITVNGSLLLEKNMDLSGQIITLGSSAALIEDAGVFSGSSGSITTTRTLSNISENVAGLGAKITTSANMGSTIITRTHNSVSGYNFKSSVLRKYTITPTTTTGLNATLEFNYLDSELNGLKEMTLQLIKSTDGGTTWIDQGGVVSTANNTVTLSGIDGFSTWGVTQLIQPMNNYALDFDGVNDYVECGNDASITEFNNLTVEAWVKLEDASIDQKIVGKYKDSGFDDFYVMGVNGREYHFEIATGDYDNRLAFSEGNVPSNTWTHLAVTFSKGNGGASGTFYGYVNGEVVYSKTDVVDAAISVSDASYPLRIGVGPWDVNAFKVDGQIDEIRIWNTSRTATEIRENMCRTLDGDESGLVAYYRLNETGGTTAYDATANGHNGTLNNMDESTDWVDSEAFNTWLGGTSNEWSTSTNWTDGEPAPTDNVGIYKWTDNNEAAISGSPTVNSLVISSTSTPTLSSGITVNGSLLLEKNMDLNGQTITLGSSATLIEDAGVFSGSSGSITTTRDLNNINENVAGLGAKITSSSNMGSTTITRAHTVQTANSNNSIARYYDITPGNNTGLNATLTFHYLDSEISGFTEPDLRLFKSTNAGVDWTQEGGTVNADNNTVSLSGIGSFSRWTLADVNSPLPVELTSFTASVVDNKVELIWQTATEVNNYGFEILRRFTTQNDTHPEQSVESKIGFVQGHGNSNSPKHYKFTDSESLSSGRRSYRLKQIDFDGQFEYSEIVAVEIESQLPKEFELFQNYPNPFNPSTTIRFALPKDSHITLEVFNILGKKAATLIDREMTAGFHDYQFSSTADGYQLTSGIYLYRLTAADFVQTRKLLLLK